MTPTPPTAPPRALTRSERRLDYFYGLVLTIARPTEQHLDDADWRAGVERMLQRSYRLQGEAVQHLRIVRVEPAADGVVIVAHHDQVLKGFSARTRGTQAGRKHRPSAQQKQRVIGDVLPRWTGPGRHRLPDAA